VPQRRVSRRDAKRNIQASTNSLLTHGRSLEFFAMLATGDLVMRPNLSVRDRQAGSPTAS